MALTRLRTAAARRSEDPVFWSDAVQLLKTVAAAVIAWLLATEVFDLPQSFLAPWAALLVVHATLYRTFSHGARQVAAAVLGVVLAWAVGNVLGLDATAVAVVLAVGLVLGAHRAFGDEATAVAATALIVLTTGFSDDDNMLVSRLFDTGIGIVVGLSVNLLVWPPLRRRTTIAAIDVIDDRLGALLQDIATGLGSGYDEDAVAAWVDRSREIDDDLDRAWSLVRQAQESAWMNPRRTAGPVRDPQTWRGLLTRLEQANAELRSMTRTLGHGLTLPDAWDPDFRDAFLALVADAGRAVAGADQDAIERVRGRIDDLAADMARTPTPPVLWSEYGGLITNLRNIVAALVEVAAHNPMGQPPMPFRRRRGWTDPSLTP